MALLSDFFILRKKTGIKFKIRLEKNVFTHKKRERKNDKET